MGRRTGEPKGPFPAKNGYGFSGKNGPVKFPGVKKKNPRGEKFFPPKVPGPGETLGPSGFSGETPFGKRGLRGFLGVNVWVPPGGGKGVSRGNVFFRGARKNGNGKGTRNLGGTPFRGGFF